MTDPTPHPKPAAEGKRTHSLRMVSASNLKSSLHWLECRGCGERWSYDADRGPIERRPCGTRSQVTNTGQSIRRGGYT